MTKIESFPSVIRYCTGDKPFQGRFGMILVPSVTMLNVHNNHSNILIIYYVISNNFVKGHGLVKGQILAMVGLQFCNQEVKD